MEKMELIQMQFALFFKSRVMRPDRLGSKIDEELDIFDKMPMNIQLPPDAPDEIPMVIMSSNSEKYRCEIAKSRINFSINYGNSEEAISVQVDNFLSYVKNLSKIIFNEVEIVRFGIVAQYFLKENHPVKRLSNKFFKEDYSSCEELSIRYNNRDIINDFEINDVVEVSKANANKNGVEFTGVFIQRDVNNLPVSVFRVEEFNEVATKVSGKFKLSSISLLV